MHALRKLTVANIRSYLRDRAAVFWTLAFPLIFIFLFGFIFQGGGDQTLNIAWVDLDRSDASGQLEQAFTAAPGVKLTPAETRAAADVVMQDGSVDTIIVVPPGFGEAMAAASTGSGPPANLTIVVDPSRSSLVGSVNQVVGSVLGVVNLGGRSPLILTQAETIQTENLTFISYFVPSILGMSVMQLGIFAAVPLVADREKGILKRLAVTPLRRSQLVGSNTLMRLLLALVQAVIIVGAGVLFFGVQVTGSLLLAAAFVVLGAVSFLSLGYVLASFTKTEDAANGITQVVQFPMMFLSGVFFPIAAMPEFLQSIARLIPLTYLADALRQVMVGGVPFAPLWVCAVVLLAWLVVCFAIASRKFRWQ